MPKSEINHSDILVRAQETPNPFAIKFVANVPLKSVGKATFNVREECLHLPLVREVLEEDGVQQVYLFQNQMTVTHNGEAKLDDLIENTISIIQSRYAVHNPDFVAEEEFQEKVKKDRSSLSKELVEVEEILDRTIRPGLQADGGDIEVVEYKEGIIRIMYQGACGGCPSAMMGTLDAIQGILRQELSLPELKVLPI